MRSPLALFCSLALASVGAACAHAPANSARAGDGSAVVLRGHRISVEIAADEISRAHGLMDRTHMPADHGMLFVFPDQAVRTFWMKDTLIPLDMLFLDARRRIVTVLRDGPPCKADPCPIYPSTQPARYVLELNGGAAARLGAREGDTAKFITVPPATH
jgi:uncharacterized membrane protein (UPF0127 family)